MKMCGYIFLSAILIVVPQIISGWDSSDFQSRPVGLQHIKFKRATVTSVIVQIVCNPSCPGNVVWYIKRYRDEPWRELPEKDVRRVLNDTFHVYGLLPGKLQYLQARHGHSSETVGVGTCFGPPHAVRNLRLGKNGPGWLDIRWTPPFSECNADFEYLTRYKVDGGTFSSLRSYGFYAKDEGGHLQIGPSHPCPDYPKEFCLLLTEDVVTGKNHIVEITVKLLNGSETDVSETKSIIAYADPKNVQGYAGSVIHPECYVWLYVGLGSCFFAIVIIITILVSSIVHTIRKANAYEREHGPPTGPFDFMEMLYS